MSQSNGDISAPVSINDVQNAIGASGGGDLATLCCHANVNKWAKYKPVPKSKIDTTDELNNLTTNKTWKSSATWWKGNNLKCGLNYVTKSSIQAVKTAIDYPHEIIWSRVTPVGGTSEPFRLIDFNQYHHTALPPTYAVGASNAELKSGATLKIQIATSVDDGYNIRFSHIGTFDSYYYTAAIYDTSGNLKLIHSATKTLSQYSDGESGDIEIPWNDGSNGGYDGILIENHTYLAYVFLSSRRYVCATSALSGTYVPLPHGSDDYGIQPVEFLCVNSSQWATIDAFASGSIISWTVGIYGVSNPPSNATLELIYLNGSSVPGKSVTVDFTTGATADTSLGVSGWKKSSTVHTTISLPASNPNPEMYQLKFTSGSIVAYAIIGHDINPNI